MKNGPALWDVVLTHVRAQFPEAVIAGGCVRDHFYERPFKDVDVFVPAAALDQFQARARELTCPEFQIGSGFDPAYINMEGSDAFLVGVQGFYLHDLAARGRIFSASPVEVQVIGLNLPAFSARAVVDRIDLGLCRLFYENGQSVAAEASMRDYLNQEMTLMRGDTDAQRHRTKERFTRLLSKYPGFAFRDACLNP